MVWLAGEAHRFEAEWTTSLGWGPVVLMAFHAVLLTAAVAAVRLLSLAAAASAAVVAQVLIYWSQRVWGRIWRSFCCAIVGLPLSGRQRHRGFHNDRHWLGIGPGVRPS